jgi:hypothetical protein
VIAFGEQVQIHFAEQLTKAVGVFRHCSPPAQRCAADRPGPGEVPDKQPRCLWRPVAEFFAVLVQHLYAQGVRQISADELSAGAIAVRAENGKRVVMFGAHQRVDVPPSAMRLLT